MPDQKTLDEFQTAPLRYKIIMAQARIDEAVEKFGVDNCYLSISGKDSSVLLDIARNSIRLADSWFRDKKKGERMYPDMKAISINTGTEFPEIIKFIKDIDNVMWLKPKMSFKKVIKKYGYPVISKNVSMAISRYRNTKSRTQKGLRLFGGINPSSGKKQTVGIIPKKYHNLAQNGSFKISEVCCDILKKNPAKEFHKKHGGVMLIGTMASDSHNRKLDYYKYGCNAFNKKIPQSRPLSLWTEKDVWDYIKENKLAYCSIYDKGYDRTGCFFCLFGINKDRDRIERLKETHPKYYKYCMEKLNYKEVLKEILPNDRQKTLSFM